MPTHNKDQTLKRETERSNSNNNNNWRPLSNIGSISLYIMAATAPFQAVSCYKTLATHVAVGMGAASFWRGAWYLLDDHLYPDDKPKSAAASLGLGIVGMWASQGLVARAERLEQKAAALLLQQQQQGRSSLQWLGRFRLSPTALSSWAVKLPRLGAVYTVAVSCVLVWRGTWVGWDVLYELYHHDPGAAMTMGPGGGHHHVHPHHSHHNHSTTSTGMLVTHPTKATDPGHATHSGLLSHGIAVGFLLTTGLMASVLAPPAAVSVIRDVAIRSSPAAAATAARAAAATTTARSSYSSSQLQQLSLVSNQWRMHGALSSSAVTTSAAAANHAFRKVHLLHQQPHHRFLSSTSSSIIRRQLSTMATSGKCF
jgi:Fuseless